MIIPRARSLCFAPLVLAACSSSETSTIAQAVCPPPGLFEHAVCVCEDLAHVGALFTKPGPSGSGSVGVNGRTALVGFSQSSGDWISWQGFSAVGVSVGESLVTSGNVSSTGDLHVGKDAVIGGDLTCVGTVAVGGTLAIGGDERIVGLASVGSRTPYTAPAGPPCNCDPSTFFDVEAAVAAAAQATGGASSWSHVGASEIRLTGGNYYVTAADVVGLTTIYVDAPSSVFVDGSLRQVGAEQWKVAPGATLDLFVSGSVLSVGSLVAGSPDDPAAFRLYVGGTGETKVGAVGDTQFFGSVYAPRSTVAYVGNAQVVGSIFAKTIRGVGTLTVEYRDPVQPPTSCDPPSDSDPDSGSGPVFR